MPSIIVRTLAQLIEQELDQFRPRDESDQEISFFQSSRLVEGDDAHMGHSARYRCQ